MHEKTKTKYLEYGHEIKGGSHKMASWTATETVSEI